MAKKRRSRAEVIKLVEQATRVMAERGVSAEVAAKQVGLAPPVLRQHLKGGVMAKDTRNTKHQVIEKVMRARAMIEAGATIDEACTKLGLSDNTYRRWSARGFKFPGVNIDQVSVASIPPRPTGGKGGKRPPKPTDFNSVESMAKRLAKIDKLLQNVQPMKIERKKIAAGLRRLLKV